MARNARQGCLTRLLAACHAPVWLTGATDDLPHEPHSIVCLELCGEAEDPQGYSCYIAEPIHLRLQALDLERSLLPTNANGYVDLAAYEADLVPASMLLPERAEVTLTHDTNGAPLHVLKECLQEKDTARPCPQRLRLRVVASHDIRCPVEPPWNRILQRFEALQRILLARHRVPQ